MRGDELNFLKNKDIFLIAIDVEGFELNVLKGLEKILKAVKFICVGCSYRLPREGINHNPEDIISFLENHDFQIISCDENDFAKLPKKSGKVQIFNLLFERK